MMVYPEWWGAIGDYQGGGSGTGTDDTTALQAALSSGAASISLAAGTYRITNALTMGGNQTLSGVSRDTSRILMDDPTGTKDTLVFNGDGTRGGDTITDLGFTNIQNMTGGACIHLQDTFYVTIEDDLFGSNGASCYNQIFVDGETSDINEIYIQQNQLFYAVNDAIDVYGATSTGGEAEDVDISNANYIQHAGHAGVGLYANVGGIYVENDIIFDNTYGIYGNSEGVGQTFGSDKFLSNDLDSDTHSAYFNGLGASIMDDNWITSDVTFVGGGNIPIDGNSFTGASSTLILEGVQGVTADDKWSDMPAAVQILPNGSSSSEFINLSGIYEYGGTGGVFAAFSGLPGASDITLGAQLDNSEKLYSGTASGLHVNGTWSASSDETSVFFTGGNVGIGTSTPANSLDVNGNGSFGGSGADTQAVLGSTQGASALNFGTGYLGFNATRSAGNWTLLSDGAHDGGSASWSDISGDEFFATIPNGGTPTASQTVTDSQVMSDVRLTIGSDGNVGVGTASPSALLSVATPNGSMGSLQNLFVISSSTSISTTTLFSVSNSGNATLFGSLGIGPSPERQLGVSGSASNVGIQINNTGGSGKPFALIADNFGNFQLKNDSTSDPLMEFTASTDVFFSGLNNFGIGTTSPYSRLEVFGPDTTLDQRLRRRQQRLDNRVHRLRHRQCHACRQPRRKTPTSGSKPTSKTSTLQVRLRRSTRSIPSPSTGSIRRRAPCRNSASSRSRCSSLPEPCLDDFAYRAHSRRHAQSQLHRPHLADRRGDPGARQRDHVARLDRRWLCAVIHDTRPDSRNGQFLRTELCVGSNLRDARAISGDGRRRQSVRERRRFPIVFHDRCNRHAACHRRSTATIPRSFRSARPTPTSARRSPARRPTSILASRPSSTACLQAIS